VAQGEGQQTPVFRSSVFQKGSYKQKLELLLVYLLISMHVWNLKEL